MRTLRAGLLGLGMMGRHHARVLSNLPGVDLVAVADLQGDPHNVAGGRPVRADVDQLIEVGLDYCVVAVPTALHKDAGLALAAAGVHALIESRSLMTCPPPASWPRHLLTLDWSGQSGTSSGTTRRSKPLAAGLMQASSALSTKSSPGGRAPSRAGLATSEW